MHPTTFLQVDQVTVNEYTPGVGMTAHVDTHSSFQECILALSLQGHMVMEFRRTGHTPRALYLPPRSLLVMADEARYGWYGIVGVVICGCGGVKGNVWLTATCFVQNHFTMPHL